MILIVLCLLINASIEAKEVRLSFDESQIFRSWVVRIIEEQLRQGPSPKWFQKDCVGLVRYSVNEALKEKTSSWYRSHGFSSQPLPPKFSLDQRKQALLSSWKMYDGDRSDYVSAIGLIQNNTMFVSKNINHARPGDLMFYDFGEAQHLMVWMGKYVAYHTGTVTKTDNGLRQITIENLFNWKDSRWRPKESNPDFIGIFRFGFLSY